MLIKPISQSTVHRICSGQVITNLSSMLKELIENSLDAHALSIEINLREYGLECIEVVDNGKGILEKNYSSLALSHFTSKLYQFEDLQSLGTFGFRGEALSSLCSVASLSIITRHDLSEVGSVLKFNELGELISCDPYSTSIGTRISVSKIFHSLPVRYKQFSKNIKREYSKLLQMVYCYCLMRFDVKFKCSNIVSTQTSLILSTPASHQIEDRIIHLFGSKMMKTLIPIEKCSYECLTNTVNNSTTMINCKNEKNFEISSEQFENIYIKGYISSSKASTSSNTHYFFLNGRPWDCSKLSRMINQIYSAFNNKYKPLVILFVNIKLDLLDINLTPDKRSILLHEEENVFKIIKISLSQIFSREETSFNSSSNGFIDDRSFNLTSWTISDTVKHNKNNLEINNDVISKNKYIPNIIRISNEIDKIHFKPLSSHNYIKTVQDNIDIKTSRNEKNIPFSIHKLNNSRHWPTFSQTKYDTTEKTGNFRAKIKPAQNTNAENELIKDFQKSNFVEMQVIGQFNLGFIVAKLGTDLFIIDQHASEEKYIFEQLQRTEIITSQPLIKALTLDVTKSQEAVIRDNLDIFLKNGFELTYNENFSIQCHSLPVSHNWIFGSEDVNELVFLLSESPGVDCRPSKVRAMLASKACRSAVMIGTALKHSEMKKILYHMGEIEHPWKCPHGRPTMRHLFNLSLLYF